MTIPASLEDAGGDKVHSLIDDDTGSNRPNAWRGRLSANQNGDRVAAADIYPRSGYPFSGYAVTTSAAEEPILGASQLVDGALVKADPDNTEDVWVGPTGITTTKTANDGYRLSPGETVVVPCLDLQAVFIRRGAATDQGVYFMAQARPD